MFSIPRRKAFTLIELLVVIAIIAILAAILFPVFAQAKAAAKSAVSLSNTKERGLASIMYAGDVDDALPETGWRGPCHNPANAANWTDTYFSGLYAFPFATRPYQKNFGIFVCPEDADKGGWNKPNSACYEQQLIQQNIPGAYVGMSATPKAMRNVFPLSYAGNYLLSNSYYGTGTTHGGMIYSTFASPANLFYLADVGSYTGTNGNVFAGWYIAPGYGNSATDTRWRKGGRHHGGRNWTFAEGHSKWFQDPSFQNPDGSYRSSADIINDYQNRGIYTYPTTGN